jgi:hypothetical protein
VGATTVGVTTTKLESGYLSQRKTLNIITEETGGLFLFMIRRDSTVLRKSEAIYSDKYDAWYAGYVLERQLIDKGELYE